MPNDIVTDSKRPRISISHKRLLDSISAALLGKKLGERWAYEPGNYRRFAKHYRQSRGYHTRTCWQGH